ncbi:MAG: hypothetical protein RSD36_15565 [Terrisporobacter sp.]
MKFIKNTVFMVCLLNCITVSAQSAENDKAQVLNVIKKYTQTIACQLGENKSKKVLNMTTNEDYTEIYYVLWWGDIGCAGGTSTVTANITEVRKNKWMDFNYNVSVSPVLEEKVYYELNPRFIEDLKRISDNKIEIISRDNDPSTINSPGKKYRYILQRNEIYGKWVLKNKFLVTK